MADPFAPTLIERFQQSKGLLALIGFLTLTFAVIGYFGIKLRSTEPELEYATVLSFGIRATEEGGRPLMNVRLDDGRKQAIGIREYVLRSCQKDDQVLLERRGLNLRVVLQACEKQDQPT